MLIIKNLQISVQDKEIVKGIDLTIKSGEVHAIMGPNGAGKTTLAMGMMGQPQFKVQSSKFKVNGEDMLNKLPEERARAGLFVSFQSPVEITGVSFLSFLRTAYKALYSQEKVPLSEFKQRVKNALATVFLPEEFMHRSLNEGFSGGEKKRAEIAQLLVLRPKFAILDEIDSGLDVDSLKIVAKAIKEVVTKYRLGIFLITHYQRILHYLRPNYVHVLMDGKIKKSGGISLVRLIEKEGYAAI
ncbi:MAG: Fe-S cluster assembly ATPase SufC [Candidatus Levyibacteriota bacterium]|nr:MAG: Fe-S cluster assembly ATPase SufC [Candidatus Levybacteria bacterium]